jgi:hypothetical protein
VQYERGFLSWKGVGLIIDTQADGLDLERRIEGTKYFWRNRYSFKPKIKYRKCEGGEG